MRFAPCLRSPWISISDISSADHESYDRDQRQYEQHHDHDSDDDYVQRIQGRRLALVIGPGAHPEHPRKHRLERVDDVRYHDFPLAPGTSKKVYDSVMVLISAGSEASITKLTDILRVSPAANVCWVKQKQSSFRKNRPASEGP